MIIFVLVLIGIAVLLYISVFLRVLLLHPVSDFKYGFKDLIKFFRYRCWHNAKMGFIVCYCGLFGKGKTLSAVHYVKKMYKRYNDKLVFLNGEFRKQKVQILSNVVLNGIPYIPFESLQQIVDISKNQQNIDDLYGYHTITYVLGDEFSVQMNSRNFKSNLNMNILNTLLTCRHFHISLIYTAQRFQNVDKLLRDVTSYVIDCNKIWRIMVHKKYDAWDMENATNVTKIKPLLRFGWFVKDSDFDSYDTLAVVDNLIHAAEEGAILSDAEIIALQGVPLNDESAISHKSHKLKKSLKKRSVI